MSEKILPDQNRVIRHRAIELVEHWALALSGLVLLLTGIFELPVGKRYYIVEVPGLGWSADFITSLYLHYGAAVVFIMAAVFHVAYHGFRSETALLPQKGDVGQSITVIKSFLGFGKEPPMGKYLPEQRLAYAGMAVIIFMLIVSGLVKTYQNIYAPDLSWSVALWATWIHNIFFILFFLAFIAHIAAILLRPNRPMVRGIFTGKVRLDYARHRHPLWMARLEPNAPSPKPEVLPAADALEHPDADTARVKEETPNPAKDAIEPEKEPVQSTPVTRASDRPED